MTKSEYLFIFIYLFLNICVTFIIGPTNVEYLRLNDKNILKNIELNVFDDIVWLWPNLISYSLLLSLF